MKRITILLPFIIVLIGNTFAQDPFVTRRDAIKLSERCYAITQDMNDQRGSVWWREKLDFSKPQTFNFVLYLGDKNAMGADGIAFVIHNDPNDTIGDGAFGDPGAGLGVADSPGEYGRDTIAPSIAIEFDTWQNPSVGDPSWDHTNILFNGDFTSQVFWGKNCPRLLPQTHWGSDNIENDSSYVFQVRWVPDAHGSLDSLSMFVKTYGLTNNLDGLIPVFQYEGDMFDSIFSRTPMLRCGFTGSTGGAMNEQSVCFLNEEYTILKAHDDELNTTMNQAVSIDVTVNDEVFSNIETYYTRIIRNPNNGLVVVADSVDVNENASIFTYYPSSDFMGIDTIEYVIMDTPTLRSYSLMDTAKVIVTVGCPNYVLDAKITGNWTSCGTDTIKGSAKADINIPTANTVVPIWFESFEDLAIGTKEDTSSTSWEIISSSCDGSSRVGVREKDGNKMFALQECTASWETEEIDISGYPFVIASMDIENNLSGSDRDYLNIYYVIDGKKYLFEYNGENSREIGVKKANTKKLSGNVLKIRIESRNGYLSNTSFWDNVGVFASTKTNLATNFSFSWKKESFDGVEISSIQEVSGLTPGIYFVSATDSITGCTTNMDSVMIESESTVSVNIETVILRQDVECNSLDGGMVQIKYDSAAANFNRFTLYDQDFKVLTSGSNTVFDELDAGKYYVVATDSLNLCVSALDSFNIDLETCEDLWEVYSYYWLSNYYSDTIRANKNGIITIPVRYDSLFSNIYLAFNLNWDSSLLKFNSIDCVKCSEYDKYGRFIIQQHGNYLSVEWEDTTGTYPDFSPYNYYEGDTLFTISFQVLGAPGTYQQPLYFGNSPIYNMAGSKYLYWHNNFREFYYRIKTINNDILVIEGSDSVTLSGTVRRSDGYKVDNALLSVEGYGTATTSDGSYSINAPKGQSVILKANYRPEAVDINDGVTTLDVLYSVRHLLGLAPFKTQYQRLAADIDGDLSVSGLDVIHQLKLVLGISDSIVEPEIFKFATSEFVSLNANDISDNFTYNYFADKDTSNLDFTMVKIGDVNQSWFSANKRVQQTALELLSFGKPLLSGDKYRIPLEVGQDFQLSAIQFSIQADGLVGWSNAKLQNVQYNVNDNSNTISLAWVDENGTSINLKKGDVIGYIELSSVHQRLHFVNGPVPSLAYNASFEEFAIASAEAILSSDIKDIDIVNYYPNPTENILYVDGLQGSCQYKLFSIVGKPVLKGQVEPGVGINVQSLPKGEYILQLKGQKRNHSLIFIKR